MTSACATASDPTRRADIRDDVDDQAGELVRRAWQQERDARDRAGRGVVAGGIAGSVPCLDEPSSRRCAEWRQLIAGMRSLGVEAPEDRYVIGQAVYALARVGAYDEALEAMEACVTDEWWCHALRGHVLAETRRIVEAGAAFESALNAMPPAVRCEWTDLSSYVWGGAWPSFEGAFCDDRLDRLEQLWWLADPAWLVPGNDRQVEHYNRIISAMLNRSAGRGEYRAAPAENHYSRTRHAQWILFGTRSLRDPVLRWDERSLEVVYGVIPRAPALLDPFHALPEDWPIVPAGMMEHYEPAFGRLGTLDHQVAFYERGDSLLAVAAAEVPDSLGFESANAARAILFLQTGHDAPPVTAEAVAERGRWLFQVPAARRRYIVGIEARSTDGVGRARFGHGLPHDERDPLRLSDLLLFVPEPTLLPDSLEKAVPRMRGTRIWKRGEVMGTYFEVYGAERAGPLGVSVELERRLSGDPSETRGAGGGEPFRLEWLLPDSDEPRPVSFTLDLRDIEPGEYILRASVGPSNAAATVTKVVRVVAASG